MKKPSEIFIGLGTNLGEKENNLAVAINLLKKYLNAQLRLSSVYRSEPAELTDQPWFLNQVVACNAGPEDTPTEVLKVLKEIESEMGRVETLRYGPRLIDLDLLFYQDWIFENTDLIVPHPKISERSFVLLPLVELAPDLVEPRSGFLLKELMEQKELGRCEKVQAVSK